MSGSALSAIVPVCKIGGISGSTLSAIVCICNSGGISGSTLSAIVPVAAFVVAHYPQLSPFVKLAPLAVAYYLQIPLSLKEALHPCCCLNLKYSALPRQLQTAESSRQHTISFTEWQLVTKQASNNTP